MSGRINPACQAADDCVAGMCEAGGQSFRLGQTVGRGVASSDLLARIMEVDPIPNVTEARWVSDFHALIQQGLHESEEGRMLRLRLDEHFGAGHPVMRECDRLIRLQSYKSRMPRVGESG